jgi:hypothetical protein
MRWVPTLPRRHRSPFVRFALALAALALLAVSVLAPVAEARAGQGMGPHVEAGGTRLHHAHIESLCPTCGAQQLVGLPGAPPARVPAAVRHSDLAARATTLHHARPRLGPGAPRAPPARR